MTEAQRAGEAGDAGHDNAEVAERMALALHQGGLQRMVARVLAAFLFSDQDSVTAGELGRQLGASAGSISSAIAMLRTVALIEPVPVPGSRRAHYRMRADAWATLLSSQNTFTVLMRDLAESALETTPHDSPAAVRLREMADFYSYLLAALPEVIERWHRTREDGRPAGG